jgi:hypothetical protein
MKIFNAIVLTSLTEQGYCVKIFASNININKENCRETEVDPHRRHCRDFLDYRISKQGDRDLPFLFLDSQYVSDPRDHRISLYRISVGFAGWLSHEKKSVRRYR